MYGTELDSSYLALCLTPRLELRQGSHLVLQILDDPVEPYLIAGQGVVQRLNSLAAGRGFLVSAGRRHLVANGRHPLGG